MNNCISWPHTVSWSVRRLRKVQSKKSPSRKGHFLSLDKYIEISKRPISIFSPQATKSGQKLKISSLKDDMTTTPTWGPSFPCMYTTSVIPLASLELFPIPTDWEELQPAQLPWGGDTTQHSAAYKQRSQRSSALTQSRSHSEEEAAQK